MKLENCPICASESKKFFKGDRHFIGLWWWKCCVCSHIFIDNLADYNADSIYEQGYRSKYQGVQKVSQEYVQALKKTKRAEGYAQIINELASERYSSALDLGSSDGSVTNQIKHLLGLDKIVGVELDRESAKFALKEYGIESFKDVAEVNDKERFEIQLLFSSHVIEHIKTPLAYLKNLAVNLSGLKAIYIEVPDSGAFDHYGDLHYLHPHYYSSQSLRLLVENAFPEFNGFVQTYSPYNHPKSVYIYAERSYAGNPGLEKAKKIASSVKIKAKIKYEIRRLLGS